MCIKFVAVCSPINDCHSTSMSARTCRNFNYAEVRLFDDFRRTQKLPSGRLNNLTEPRSKMRSFAEQLKTGEKFIIRMERRPVTRSIACEMVPKMRTVTEICVMNRFANNQNSINFNTFTIEFELHGMH